MFYTLTGFLAGICTGLGFGGGSVLILLLTTMLNVNQHTAQATNIVFFIASSIITIFINIKNKNIVFKSAYIIIIFGVIGAIIGAILSSKLDVSILRKCFGIFLIFIAINGFISFSKQKNNNSNIK